MFTSVRIPVTTEPNARSRRRQPSALRLVGLFGVALFLPSCAASSPAAPSGQTPTAASSHASPIADLSPSASPRPNLLASSSLSCDITGKVKEFPFLLYGLFDVNGMDDHLLVTQEGPDEPFVYEELAIESAMWARSNASPWTPRTDAADEVPRLRRSIDQVSSWTDVGPGSGASQPLRRLKAAGAPVDASDFGLEYPADFDSSLSLEIETASNGSPVAMHLAGKSLNAELSCGGRALSRSAAPPSWKTVELAQGVSIAVAEDWELDRSDPKRLVIVGPDRQWIAVQGATAKGLTLAQWTSDGAAYFSKEWQATPLGATSITVANQEAALTTWHMPLEGQQSLFLDVAAVRDGWGYDIEFFSQTQREPADRALFEQILTSVAFGKR